MSDDEEVIFQGSDLYRYLNDQGYSDFTSLSPTFKDDYVTSLKSHDISAKNDLIGSYQQVYEGSEQCIMGSVSANDRNILLSVLHSQLLFKEDIDVLEPVLSCTHVCKDNSNLFSYLSLGMAGFFVSMASLFTLKISRYFTTGMTLICTTFSTWIFYQQFIKSQENRLFNSHLNLLRTLCSNAHKVYRCLKETEIISTGQVSTNNVGVAAYSPLPIGLEFHKSKDLDTLQSWKTLPQTRRCLMTVLIEMINLFNEACEAMKATTQPMMYNCLPELLENKTTLKVAEEILNTGQCISLKCLQSVTDIYLVLQSEYLKRIALSFHNATDMNIRPDYKKRKDIFKMISNLQSELENISLKLLFQYHSLNISTVSKLTNKCTKQSSDKNNLQVEIHNISLIMLSILLRVRSLEDFLAEKSNIEVHNETNMCIRSQLTSLKDDLSCAVKHYDSIYSRILFEDKVIPESDERDIKNSEDIKDARTKETGVTVGVSDFSVNSPDEVFLAISGNSTQGQNDCFDDWLFETKPQVPKKLMEELSETLKSRKLNFIEREKLALERQGLEDIQDSTGDSSTDESFESKKQVLLKRNKRRLCGTQRSTSEDDDDAHKEKTARDVSYKKLHTDTMSDSDKSFSDNDDNNDSPKQNINLVNNSSLASLIAMRSQLWKKCEEEQFSDG